MLSIKRKFLLILMALCFCSFSYSEQHSSQDIDDAANKALTTIVDNLPESLLLLTAESDSYIGKMVPSVPPHFSAGLNISATIINTTDITTVIQYMMDNIDYEYDINDTISIPEGTSIITQFLNIPEFTLPEKIPLPTTSLNARIGGIYLPFDIGLLATFTIPNILDTFTITPFEYSYNISTFGADLRFAICKGGFILPKISLGLGYIYSNQKHSFNLTRKNIETSDGSGYTSSEVNFDMNCQIHTFFAQVQVSKKILFLVPYAGLRVRYVVQNSNYSWSYLSQYQQNDGFDDYSTISEGSGSGSYSNSFDDFQWTMECLNPTVYGGIGFKMPYSELSLNASWNIVSNYFSFGLLTEFKL